MNSVKAVLILELNIEMEKVLTGNGRNWLFSNKAERSLLMHSL